MNWSLLCTEEQLKAVLEKSFHKPQVIFKHSTRCSISSVVKTRLERAGFSEKMDFHFLDLIAYRSLSNTIAEELQVYHESPQVLLLHKGECVYDESHMAISMEELNQWAA